MLENRLKKQLAEGHPIVGAWLLMPCSMAAESLASGGLDFLILDMEHGAFDAVSLDHCIRAVESGGAAPIVRVPGLNASAAQWALDSGAHGIIVPQVDGYAQALEAVALGKFPPAGTRGYNPFVRAANYSGKPDAQGSKLHNAFPLACIIVETQRSLDELEKICTIEGLDVIYIGVYDLAIALGLNGDVTHPRIQELVKQAVATITAAGKTAGLMARSLQTMQQAMALGAKFILGGIDTDLLRTAAHDLVTQCHKAAK